MLAACHASESAPDLGASTVDSVSIDATADPACASMGIACVTSIESVTALSVALDADGHPLVAYGAPTARIQVQRWSGTAWEPLGAAIADRDASPLGSGFRLFVLGDVPHLVSRSEDESLIHVDRRSGAAWEEAWEPPVGWPSARDGTLLMDSAAHGATLLVAFAKTAVAGPFLAAAFDGAAWTPLTGASGALVASDLRVSVSSTGQVAVAYVAGAEPGVRLTTRAPDSSWPPGPVALAVTSPFGFALTAADRGVLAHAAGTRLVAEAGDDTEWTMLGDAIDEGSAFGVPAVVEDGDGHAVVVYTALSEAGQVVRAKRWNGNTWIAVAESAPTLATTPLPTSPAAALRDGKVAWAVIERTSPGTHIVAYGEAPVP